MRMQIAEVTGIEMDEFEVEDDQTLALGSSIVEQKIRKAEKGFSTEQEREFIRRYQETGDEEAFEDLLEFYQPYLERVADYYHKKGGFDYDDLLQETQIGFRTALKNFDLKKHSGRLINSTLFSSVRNTISRFLSDNDDREMLALDQLVNVRGDQFIGLSDTWNDYRGSLLVLMERRSDIAFVREAVNTAKLSNKQRAVAWKRILEVDPLTLDKIDPPTLEEMGKEIGVTRERVRQIEAKASKIIVQEVRAIFFGLKRKGQEQKTQVVERAYKRRIKHTHINAAYMMNTLLGRKFSLWLANDLGIRTDRGVGEPLMRYLTTNEPFDSIRRASDCYVVEGFRVNFEKAGVPSEYYTSGKKGVTGPDWNGKSTRRKIRASFYLRFLESKGTDVKAMWDDLAKMGSPPQELPGFSSLSACDSDFRTKMMRVFRSEEFSRWLREGVGMRTHKGPGAALVRYLGTSKKFDDISRDSGSYYIASSMKGYFAKLKIPPEYYAGGKCGVLDPDWDEQWRRDQIRSYFYLGFWESKGVDVKALRDELSRVGSSVLEKRSFGDSSSDQVEQIKSGVSELFKSKAIDGVNVDAEGVVVEVRTSEGSKFPDEIVITVPVLPSPAND
ncbi:MAG TPA: hypothetical protein DEA55_01840 [Rhodospirillaceae bacterium]|nr:hypothetical protein [Rhodospirillaceae bacterium]